MFFFSFLSLHQQNRGLEALKMFGKVALRKKENTCVMNCAVDRSLHFLKGGNFLRPYVISLVLIVVRILVFSLFCVFTIKLSTELLSSPLRNILI